MVYALLPVLTEQNSGW